MGMNRWCCGSGQVKLVQLDKTMALLVPAPAKNWMLEAWTMVPTAKLNYINK